LTEYDFGEMSFAIRSAAKTRPIPVIVAVIANGPLPISIKRFI